MSLLWQTRQSPRDLLGRSGFDPRTLAVPTLIFRDESIAKRIPTYNCEEGWKLLCSEVFKVRSLSREMILSLDAAAESTLAEFTGEMAKQLPSIPAGLRPHVEWLPELTARLACTFWILAGNSKTVVEKPAMVEAVKATKWLGRQHLLAAAAAMIPTDNADKKPVLLAKLLAKAPITRRDLRRTFDDQKVRWFDDALDTLFEEKKVRYDDSGRLVPCLSSVLAVAAVPNC